MRLLVTCLLASCGRRPIVRSPISPKSQFELCLRSRCCYSSPADLEETEDPPSTNRFLGSPHTLVPTTRLRARCIYLLIQSKNGISAMDLKRQLGVSYNTAWMLKHKLMQTMRERDDSQPLRGIVELDDAYLGGETSGGKRGRGAARKTPFVAAAQVSADGRPERLRLSPVAGFRKRALQAWAERHLRAGTLVRSDGLACFRGVQAAGCVHCGFRRK